jgi:hypothetical protein
MRVSSACPLSLPVVHLGGITQPAASISFGFIGVSDVDRSLPWGAPFVARINCRAASTFRDYSSNTSRCRKSLCSPQRRHRCHRSERKVHGNEHCGSRDNTYRRRTPVCSRRRDRDKHQSHIPSRQELLVQPEANQGVQPASLERLVRRGCRGRRREKKACARLPSQY